MGSLGKVRIGHRAPEFHCDAIIKGLVEEVCLETYISDNSSKWLILLFIPAAFSFVCPTEVLAFQNCLDEFRDRNCEVVFVSVDTKHSLWHWQNVPRQYGGLGQIDIALLSDASHKMSRDYGVLIEEEGVCLRGMYIIDNNAIVQQVTLNNLPVGRSVLEALRLLEAFQAVAKHGVLCPVDWRPSGNTADNISTISNTLIESYDDRLANLQKEFGDTVVTDLDARHKKDDESRSISNGVTGNEDKKSREGSTSTTDSSNTGFQHRPTPPNKDSNENICSPRNSIQPTRRNSSPTNNLKRVVSSASSDQSTSLGIADMDCLPHRSPGAARPNSAPVSASVTPTPTPTRPHPPHIVRNISRTGTARHSRGHTTAPHAPHHHTKHTTYESRRGSHVILEFADPTLSPQGSPSHTPGLDPSQHSLSPSPILFRTTSSPSPILSRTTSLNPNDLPPSRRGTPRLGGAGLSPRAGAGVRLGMGIAAGSPGAGAGGNAQTRLQMTFEAIKKMSTGLASPRLDFSPKKGKGEGGDAVNTAGATGNGNGDGTDADAGGEAGWGYFDVVSEVVEA
ncbi:thioredoxin-like protein [Dendryphion nanum]|uniref:Thioredoxin-like protein n=1 Tax=Dendryphion nanum TaxID=256645 RepID=A0A9P9IM42_9PLEO|nr:thioredoxin-like protein [Dendryphion nanum]